MYIDRYRLWCVGCTCDATVIIEVRRYKPKAIFVEPPSVRLTGNDHEEVEISWTYRHAQQYHHYHDHQVKNSDDDHGGSLTLLQLPNLQALFALARTDLIECYTAYLNHVLDQTLPPDTVIGALLLEPLVVGAGI
jgi:hypothetical protein